MKRTIGFLVAVAALGMTPAVGADVRVGPNHRLSSDDNAARGRDAVSLTVNPANPQHIISTSANYLTGNCEASASFDSGATWSAAIALAPPVPGVGSPFRPSCRMGTRNGDSMYQSVAFGSGGKVYAVSTTPRANGGTEEGASVLAYRSTDGGLTWSTGVTAVSGGTGTTVTTGPDYVLPAVAVDPGAGAGGADRVYVAARDLSGVNNFSLPCPQTSGAQCPPVRTAVSNDSVSTFSPPVQASGAGVSIADGASMVVGADHAVSVAWRTSGATGSIQFVRSTNQGATWSAPVAVTTVTNLARRSDSHVTTQAGTSASFPRLAIDKANGNLYVVYNQGGLGPTAPAGGYQGADHFIPPDSHVYFQRSLTNGSTWSTPKLVDSTTIHPGTQIVQTRHPNVAVAPGGRIDIVWEDRRHWYQGPGERTCLHVHLACDDARLGDIYYSSSADGGATFSANRRVTDRSHNNDVGYDYRFGTYQTFGPQSVAIGADTLLVAWLDSREGDFGTNVQDVYVAPVDLAAGATVPAGAISEPDAVALSVALSRSGYPGGGESLLAGALATRRATRVVIVNQDDVAGALAGGVLARANLAPVLLSPAGGLPAGVKAEVARLAPAGAFVVGDSSRLSDQVVADLAAAGVDPGQVTRIAGNGDAGTAAAMAALMDKRSQFEKDAAVPAFDAAVIANPAGPDAAAAAGLAAARRLPILYVTTDAIPPQTSAALSSLSIDTTLVIGGAAQVGATVRDGLPTSTRLGGADQYGTSEAVVDESRRRGLPANVVYVADGGQPMGSALLGSAVGRATGVMVLAPAPLPSTAATRVSGLGLNGVDRLVLASHATPAPTGPAGATTPPPAGPVGGSVPAGVPAGGATPLPQRPSGRLSATLTPTRDLRAPFVFRLAGRLSVPTGITESAGCQGRIRVTVARGRTVIRTRRVKLTGGCTYRATVSFANRRSFGRVRRLKFSARFEGNKRVAPSSARPRYARVRR